MTDSRPSSEPTFLAAATTYLVAGLAAVGLLSLTLWQEGGGRWAIVPTLIGAAGLVFLWRSAPLGLIAAVAFGKVVPGWYYGRLGFQRLESLSGDFVLCAAVLGYLIAQYRLLSLQRALLPTDPRLPKSKPVVRNSASVPARELPAALLTGAAAIVGAFLIWQLTATVGPFWNLEPMSWRIELLIWIMAVVLIATASIIGYLGWRRQSRPEALLVLRDEFWRQTRGEQRRTNRWRAWARRRQERL